MLKYKLNNKGLKRTYVNLAIDSVTGTISGNEVNIKTDDNHGMVGGDDIVLRRESNNKIYFSEEKSINKDGLKGFSFRREKTRELYPSSIDDILFIPCIKQPFSSALRFNFTSPHNIITIRDSHTREDIKECENEGNTINECDRDIVISEIINGDSEYNLYYKNYGYNRYCGGDYVIHNNIFLLKSEDELDENGKYVFTSESLKNTFHDVTLKMGDSEMTIRCMVPCSSNGMDNPNSLYFFYECEDEDEYKLSRTILSNFYEYTFSVYDDRFFEYIEDYIKYTDKDGVEYEKNCEVQSIDDKYTTIKYKDGDDFIEKRIKNENIIDSKQFIKPHLGTKFYRVCGDVEVNFSIGEDFETNLMQEEVRHEQLSEKYINENINPVVDMEKQIFRPIIVENGIIKNEHVNKLCFNLNFLSRSVFDGNKVYQTWIDGFTPTKSDIGEVYRCEDLLYCDTYLNYKGGTSLTDLGFTNEDFLYQKNCIKKSFIRLSFYDTPSRSNQSLLYYSTIFLDSHEIYWKYLNKEKNECSVSVSSPYDRSKCSEGYYLYLFPSILTNNAKINSDGSATIYMKIEFNHAKYGYTIPMTAPQKRDYKINGYISNDNYSESMGKLMEDMYLPVKIVYNKERNYYGWYLDTRRLTEHKVEYIINNDSGEGIITFNLYEPIANRINS